MKVSISRKQDARSTEVQRCEAAAARGGSAGVSESGSLVKVGQRHLVLGLFFLLFSFRLDHLHGIR